MQQRFYVWYYYYYHYYNYYCYHYYYDDGSLPVICSPASLSAHCVVRPVSSPRLLFARHVVYKSVAVPRVLSKRGFVSPAFARPFLFARFFFPSRMALFVADVATNVAVVSPCGATWCGKLAALTRTTLTTIKKDGSRNTNNAHEWRRRACRVFFSDNSVAA